ncbi:MAG: hypothetical protein IPO81_00245 [Kouleothrix sp.]|nr:hypothetical protein [Kouleothrix sp.]
MRTYLLAAALLAALLSSGFSSVTSAAASPLQNLSDADIGEALAAHNAVRQRVAQAESQRLGSPVVIPDLTWNSDLATYAQEWADQLLSSDPDPDPDRRTFPHHDWGELQALGRGENIYAGWSDGGVPDQSPTAAVTWWDSEQQYYDYDTNTCAADQTCGHFTQLVWSTTTQVGCGQAVRTAAYGTQFVVWVCNYAPAGNIIGERPYDVMTVAQPDVEQQVVDLVNSERQQAGCGPVTIDPRLTEAARTHSQDMAANNFLSSLGSDGSEPGARLSAAGYAWSTYGETIAAGFPTAEQVMSVWMQGSADIILNCDYTQIGVGHEYAATSAYGHYWTQDFAIPTN